MIAGLHSKVQIYLHRILLPWCEVGEDSDSDAQDSIPSHPSLQTSIHAVDDVDALRYFALASYVEANVLRRSSCLQCCLDLCRNADI